MTKLRDPLTKLVLGATSSNEGVESGIGILKHYGFVFATCIPSTDVNFLQLLAITNDLSDPKVTMNWKATDCKLCLEKIYNLLCPCPSEEQSIVPHKIVPEVLKLFEYLGSAEKVWEFVHSRPDYIANDGTGYSGVFRDKVEDFLSQLGSDDCKILNMFEEVVKWIAVLAFHQRNESSFASLMNAVQSSTHIMVQAQYDTNPFSQLITAESNMDFLTNLFLKGLGGLDAVLGQFKSIINGCIYIFDLTQHSTTGVGELKLAFIDQQKARFCVLNGEEVFDLQQRLGFVQHEEKARVFDIETFLKKLQNYSRSLQFMCELYSLGHVDWTVPIRTLSEGETTFTKDLLQQFKVSTKPYSTLPVSDISLSLMEDTLESWKLNIYEVMNANEFLCLFSTVAARHMDSLITRKEQNQLALLMSPLISDLSIPFNDVVTKVAAALKSIEMSVVFEFQTYTWPVRAARFLKEFTEKVTLKHGSSNVDKIESGPMLYSAEPSHSIILHLLVHIFKGRPRPKAYEVLWCDKDTTLNALYAFLQRSKHHPEGRFALVQANLVTPALQHVILCYFLETRDISTN